MIENLLNPIWRINNLYKIINKQKREVLFCPNIVQSKILEYYQHKRVILKARQMGVSTSEIINILDATIWNENQTNAILAHKKDDVGKLFRIATNAYRLMPPELRPVIARGGGSKYEMYFPEINSRIYCGLEIRGDTLSRLHVSEMAFMRDPDRLIATLQALPNESIVSIESTPNGLNHFYDLYNTTEIYTKFFFPWYVFKEYQINCDYDLHYTKEENLFIEKAKMLHNIDISKHQILFRRMKKEECKLGVNVKFEQEYPEDDESCFLQSGSKIFDMFKVKDLLDNVDKNPTIKKIKYSKDENIKYDLEIYKPFDKNKTYVIGCDVAEGIPSATSDFSVIHVLCVEDIEQVAFFQSRVKPSIFADIINQVSLLYWNKGMIAPLLAVERNNHGHAVILALEENYKYPNLYHAKDGRPGWITSIITRPLMLDKLIKTFDNNELIINSRQTLEEFKTFIDENGKMQASNGKHDDAIISLSIALEMLLYQMDINQLTDIGSYIRV